MTTECNVVPELDLRLVENYIKNIIETISENYIILKCFVKKKKKKFCRLYHTIGSTLNFLILVLQLCKLKFLFSWDAHWGLYSSSKIWSLQFTLKCFMKKLYLYLNLCVYICIFLDTYIHLYLYTYTQVNLCKKSNF